MHILIICQYFPPENKIGAVRPSKLAKYLNRYENTDVSVLTVEPIEGGSLNLMDDYYGAAVYRAAVPPFVKKLNRFLKRRTGTESASTISKDYSSTNKSRNGGLTHQVRKLMFSARESVLDIAYYLGAKRILNSIGCKFDVVISTYNTEFGHKVGLWYKKRHPEIRWITDYRDPLCGSYSTVKQRKHGTKFVRRVSNSCDAITVVAKGISDIHREDFGNKPVYVIPNGYDSEDPVPTAAESADSIVRIVYTGELYNGKRDLTPLFRAISELEKQKKIGSEDIEVVYAGKSGDSFFSQISRFPGIKSSCLGFVSREKALTLQSGADILLLASWCEPNDKEVLTGKFFEYLQMKKPIVCIISGRASGCALTRIINEHSLGLSYEAVNEETDYKLLCSYIDKQVSAKKQFGHAEFVGDDEYVSGFDYKTIAERFYRILNYYD